LLIRFSTAKFHISTHEITAKDQAACTISYEEFSKLIIHSLKKKLWLQFNIHRHQESANVSQQL